MTIKSRRLEIHYREEFGDVYNELLRALLSKEAVTEKNYRTNSEIKTFRGGCSFIIDTAGMLPVPYNRKVYPKTAAAEVAWYLMGTKDVEWLHKHTKIWKKFYDYPNGKEGDRILDRSYGYRWREQFGRDQILCAIKGLRHDESSRRIYVTAWDAGDDGLNALHEDQKNVPCPIGFTLSIIDGELHSSLFLRSSDVFVGLPYDVMGHTILMSLFASELQVEMGTLQVTLAHPHLYESHYISAAITLGEKKVVPYFELPKWTIQDVVKQPDVFVQNYEQIANNCSWAEYDPKPEVIV